MLKHFLKIRIRSFESGFWIRAAQLSKNQQEIKLQCIFDCKLATEVKKYGYHQHFRKNKYQKVVPFPEPIFKLTLNQQDYHDE